MKMAKKVIDLDLIKRLVSELESQLEKAETIKAGKGDKIEWVVELGKASGLAASMMSESALLMGDIQALSQGAPAANKQDFIEKFLGGLKGPGNAN
jgi:hypothetical protein